jgi:5-deoxy-D-glucuronate isomerase
MDRIDKHRELILVACTGQVNVRANAEIPAIGVIVPWEVRPRIIQLIGREKVDMKAEMTVQVALSELSERKDQPLIPTLQNLLRFTSDAIESFAEEFA